MIRSRVLISGAVVSVSFLLVVISALRVAQPNLLTVQSPGKVLSAKSAMPSPVALSATDTTLIYSLPYPGILPDHPLYWAKMIRDRFHLWLTHDQVSRTQLLLLFADKRLGAGQTLIENGQSTLGTSTITKAEKYLIQAGNQLKQTDKNNIDDQKYYQLASAFLSHKRVIEELLPLAADTEKDSLTKAMTMNTVYYETNLKPQLPIWVTEKLSNEVQMR